SASPSQRFSPPTPLPNPFALPCLQKQSTLAPREYSPPQKNLGPAGGKKGRGVQGQSRRKGGREGRKEGKTLRRKTPPNSSSSPKSFPPLTGCKLGPGAQPPGPRRAFYRNFRRGIFPPPPVPAPLKPPAKKKQTPPPPPALCGHHTA